MTDASALQHLETFYDAVPRAGARVEPVGPFALFVREGAGWPFYARPAPGSPDRFTVDDVRQVRARQVEVGVPEALEWVHDLAPSLTAAAREAGLTVQLCPLMVLDPQALTMPEADDVSVRIAGPDDADLALAEAVASVAFGAGIGTAVGEAGVDERDETADQADPSRLAMMRAALRAGTQVRAVARRDGAGPVGVGGYQHAAGVAELVGIATLPSARRRGIAAAVAGVLAREALSRGLGTVFLSAQDEDVARVYERVGFRRLGTAGLAEP